MATKRDVPHLLPAQWGRDHWILFGHVMSETYNGEGLLVEDTVVLDKKGLRVNPNRHPQHYHRGNWRLRSGFKRGQEGYPDGSVIASGERVKDHDDIDVLVDFEREGFVIVRNWSKLVVSLTPRGVRLAEALRVHLASGGKSQEFHIPIEEADHVEANAHA